MDLLKTAHLAIRKDRTLAQTVFLYLDREEHWKKWLEERNLSLVSHGHLVETQGLGTSLKILFSERQIEALSTSSVQRPSFQLSRQEIVSLLNAFGRISTSIRELKNFRSLLAEER
ncbi:hypothetical protein L3Q82_000099 [Scortum barcoo]|uniref:Uncharacterized protein n=1 Tax=Scortum barcoo TaxID=214431 RepID=A0ACB8XA09_9TELE|nr:hypothetical protein L3Q82_000099 [Scortum barcoo]